MPISEFVIRLLLAVALGAFVGFERQWRQKNAGLKTNTLVSLGSAAFMLLSVSIHGYNVDPTRIAGQIVTGIGFLGAGVIMRHGFTVMGLNTAATIWCSAAVGTLAGIGLYVEAVITAIVIVFSHIILRPIEVKLIKSHSIKTEDDIQRYELILKTRKETENHIRVLLMQELHMEESLMIRSLKSTDDIEAGIKTIITAEILSSEKQDRTIEKIVSRLTIEKGVLEVSWILNSSVI
jgi:putative Mg2+ transporter-C (MgtC) family protein